MAPNRQRAGHLWREELAEQAVQLYSQGHGYRTVANLLSTEATEELTDDGVTKTPARSVSHTWVKRVIDKALAERIERTREATDALVVGELLACKEMERSLAPQVAAGDPEAIRTRLRIMDRRARYLGLDAPVEISAASRAVPPALQARIDHARSNVEQRRQAMIAGPALPGSEVVQAELVD